MTHKNKPNNRKNNNAKESKADKAERIKRERRDQIRRGVCPFDSSRLEAKTVEAFLNGNTKNETYFYCPTCKKVYTLEGDICNRGDAMERVSKQLPEYDPKHLNLNIKIY